MDLGLTPDQQALVDVFASFLAGEVPVERVRGAEPLGFDQTLWSQAVAMGVPDLAVGDLPAALLDLALLAELAGARLAPIPLPEAWAAGRLLAAAGSAPAAGALPTVALFPVRDGLAPLVPAGAVADVVVALADGLLVVVDRPEARPAPRNLGSLPLADVPVSAARVLAEGATARRLHAAAVADWQVLTAAALAGLAGAALRLGVDHVKTRHQFGVPIGSFQAVQHRWADVATAVDGARLLAFKAAWGIDETAGPSRRAEEPAMAFWFAGQAAQRSTAASLQFHGGYGFMIEYDIQLFHRRAKAWTLAGGDPRRCLRAIAATRYPVAAAPA